MKLLYAPASPFARKVRILAQEIGLSDSIEAVKVNPWDDETLRAHNPLCQVPTLIADDGDAIYDSRVICIFLDRIAGSGRVTEAEARSLVLEALADGVCDAGVRRVREQRLPQDQRNREMLERQNRAMRAGLDEAERTLVEGPFDIGEMALVSALGYLRFRMGEDDWFAGRPRLKAWFETVSARPSVSSTEPA